MGQTEAKTDRQTDTDEEKQMAKNNPNGRWRKEKTKMGVADCSKSVVVLVAV